MNAAQHKMVKLLKIFFFFFFFAHQFSLVFVYSMCGPEVPKGWAPSESFLTLGFRLFPG